VLPQEVEEGLGVSVQVLVPLHDRNMQVVEVQEMAVPWQAPPPQMSS
jgi:hypothetical protein